MRKCETRPISSRYALLTIYIHFGTEIMCAHSIYGVWVRAACWAPLPPSACLVAGGGATEGGTDGDYKRGRSARSTDPAIHAIAHLIPTVIYPRACLLRVQTSLLAPSSVSAVSVSVSVSVSRTQGAAATAEETERRRRGALRLADAHSDATTGTGTGEVSASLTHTHIGGKRAG
jgi:hypothetical protein